MLPWLCLCVPISQWPWVSRKCSRDALHTKRTSSDTTERAASHSQLSKIILKKVLYALLSPKPNREKMELGEVKSTSKQWKGDVHKGPNDWKSLCWAINVLLRNSLKSCKQTSLIKKGGRWVQGLFTGWMDKTVCWRMRCKLNAQTVFGGMNYRNKKQLKSVFYDINTDTKTQRQRLSKRSRQIIWRIKKLK